jgi:predicted DNA-binding WGR domain protein
MNTPVKALGFVNVEGDARSFWTVRFDLDNKRVTVFTGRLGTTGRKSVRLFSDRPSTRRYVENRINAKLRKGFVQISA